MQPPLIDTRLYETYYHASCVKRILEDQFAYLRNLHDFYGDDAMHFHAHPFPKYSSFHKFLEFIIDELVFSSTESCKLDLIQDAIEQGRLGLSAPGRLEDGILPIERALKYYDIEHTSFTSWLGEQGVDLMNASSDEVAEYLLELRLEGPMEVLISHSVREAFFVLFFDRDILLKYNDMMASVMSSVEIDEVAHEHRGFFAANGVLKRARPPEWAKRAVFYRDRGVCCFCRKDLSGLLNVCTDENFDHIVPLERGGLNDISNLQLLCRECNLRKSAGSPLTSTIHEDWYDIEES